MTSRAAEQNEALSANKNNRVFPYRRPYPLLVTQLLRSEVLGTCDKHHLGALNIFLSEALSF